jgi:hypothetical protein
MHGYIPLMKLMSILNYVNLIGDTCTTFPSNIFYIFSEAPDKK